MAYTSSSNLNLGGLRCGANRNRDGFSNRLGQGPCSLAIKNNDAVWRGIRRRGRISMTTAMEAKTGSKKVETTNNSETGKVGREKLDEWMTRSVVEVVRNLRSAPLMVQVHAENNNNNNNNSSKMWLETEKAEEEKWGMVKRKWEKGEAPMPNGLILVEELGDQVEKNIESERVWGIVVQGRKDECGGGGPLCYLLKTTSVASGLGMCCTHFCLVQVKGFRETADSQLKNSWLVQAAFSS